MATRARGRPVQSAVSDDNLLEAVLQSFAENGYDGTSVREIARGLDVSHNLIPQRFGSKETLWYAAVDHGFGRLIEDLMHEAETLGSDELLVLRGLVASCIELNALHPSLLQIINQEASQPGPLHRRRPRRPLRRTGHTSRVSRDPRESRRPRSPREISRPRRSPCSRQGDISAQVSGTPV